MTPILEQKESDSDVLYGLMPIKQLQCFTCTDFLENTYIDVTLIFKLLCYRFT